MTHHFLHILRSLFCSLHRRGQQAVVLLEVTVLFSCSPEPPLHLYDAQEAEFNLPLIDLELDLYWDYELAFGIDYNWRAEWFYGWDDEDRRIFGELGYEDPNAFNIRRYYTGDRPRVPHTGVISDVVDGRHFLARYDWGFWDILVWNQVNSIDGVQSLIFDETTSLDSVTAYTNPSMRSSRYNAPRFTQAFYAPEPLFAAYDRAIEINSNLDGFEWDAERQAYVRTLEMTLMPVTYIYLTQVILHNNRGRVSAVEGSSDLSGMARSTNVNIGRGGQDAVTVTYGVRFKPGCTMYHRDDNKQVISQEKVDVVGGRLMTFGICNLRANKVKHPSEIIDNVKHFMDMKVQFNNGVDTTFVFHVTDQVRRRFKGGVITVEVDMDTIPVPIRGGGSAFDAVVKDYEEETHEFDM